MAKRIENVGDLWSDLHKTKRSLRLPMQRLDICEFTEGLESKRQRVES